MLINLINRIVVFLFSFYFFLESFDRYHISQNNKLPNKNQNRLFLFVEELILYFLLINSIM